MNGRERKVFVRYLRSLADAMGLRDWEIILGSDAAKDGALASIDCLYGQRRAELVLCENFRSLTPRLQRETLVHELIHCHHAVPSRLVRRNDELDKAMGVPAHALFADAWNEAHEHAVDAVSVAWAPFFPLIDW